MDTLAAYVRTQLERDESCTVFAEELARVWPEYIDVVDERNRAIEEFAEARGWTAVISDPGPIVTFAMRHLSGL